MGSCFKVEADQRTDSVEMIQKFGDYSLKLTIFGEVDLPRLRRLPNSDRWQPMFICMGKKGIEVGAYSHPENFFTMPSYPDMWGDRLMIEGWVNGGSEDTNKIIFVYKDGTISEHINDFNREWDNITYETRKVVFGMENPVVEIQIYSTDYK